jgi:putative oxidoreductase
MLKKFLNNNKDIGLLLLRVGIGLSFIFTHGGPKLVGGPDLWERVGHAMSNYGITFLPIFWGTMAMLSEFAGGILVLLGLYTRSASAFMAFTMLTAFIGNLSRLSPWGNVSHPFEMLAVFLCLIFFGAGKYSLNYLFFKKG